MSIPEGICVDLETTLAARVPDTVRPPGKKRLETRIIEIGACCWHKQAPEYQCLVNPLAGIPMETPEDMFSALRDRYQRPDATINFWSRVLAHRTDTLTSAMCNGMHPQIWDRCTVKNKTKDFIRWFNEPGSGPDFKTEKQALEGLLQYSEDCGESTWLAHNGKSFDFKVLEGAGERSHTSISNIQQKDTLHIFKKKFDLKQKSYSQPKLYKSLGLGAYNAHVAIDDARALAEICQFLTLGQERGEKTAILTQYVARPEKIIRRKNNPNTDPVIRLKGIGPKSRDTLARYNIRTISELKHQFNTKGVDWLRRTLPRGVRWRMVTHSLAAVAFCTHNK
jgi:hypothetical protein